jgi:D-aminopeptidase
VRPYSRPVSDRSLRDHGLRIGDLEAGAENAITDVPGVTVGHVTIWRDEPTVARTGVTAILPGPVESLLQKPVPAGTAVLNGAGELTGSLEIREWGILETPVYLTSTHAVGRVMDGAVAVALDADPAVGVDNVVIPVVGECDDSWLSDARVVQVELADVAQAVANAGSSVEQGAVGAGTGMTCLGHKGGIGTSSRVVPELGCTLGVLALTNFGEARELRIDGVPIGRMLPPAEERPEDAGSCIVVVATDAALTPAQLERVARRAGLGLARTGSVAHHGSGEIFVAFATTAERSLRDEEINPLFSATVDATEESVVNSLWAAKDVTGREGRVVTALPHDDVLELLEQAQRLPGRGR